METRDTSKSEMDSNNVHPPYYCIYFLKEKIHMVLQQGSLRISHIGVHTVLYKTSDLFFSTNLEIYDK